MRSNLFDTLCPIPTLALAGSAPTHPYEDIGWTIFVLAVLLVYGWRCYAQSDERRVLIYKWAASIVLLFVIWAMWHLVRHSPLMFGLFVLPCVFFGIIWTPEVITMALKPLTGLFEGSYEEVEAKPFYFIASAKRMKGLHQEAVSEVRKQLEKFPGDVAGLMLLATIQAEDLHDLPAAEATINELLEQPILTPQETATALHTMADWQLQHGRDPKAARGSLERIALMLPGSQFAHAAGQRIAKLGDVVATRDFRENAKFEVPQRERDIGLRQDPQPAAETFDADAKAAEYVSQLENHPTDTSTREKLAVLYAEHFQRLDLAVDQLEQLISLPDETPKHVARWLNLLATLHIGIAHDEAAAKTALLRIVAKFPKSASAEVANLRIASLRNEMKSGLATPSKSLGIYERDIGLKKPAV
jgi:hypothetical protein